MTFFLGVSERWSFSKNTWKSGVLCIFDIGGVSFSYKHEITLLSKRQRLSSPENALKNGISGINKKADVHPGKDDIDILD